MKNDSHKKNRSISRDLTISLVLIIVLVSGTLIALNYLTLSQKAKAQLEQKANEYVSYLLDSLELPIWNIDEESVAKIGRSYINNELIARLRITDSSGNVMFEQVKPDERDLIEREGEITHAGKIIGHIEIGLTSRLYEENNSRLLWSSILTMLVIILSVIGATGFLLRIFLRSPLNHLIQGIDRIAGGEYEYQFYEAKQREIETIISKFNYMAQQIKGREQSLTEINKQLADEIAERKLAQETLHESEERYRTLVDTLTDFVFTLDKDGSFTYLNRKAEDLSGYAAKDLIGRHFTEILAPEYIEPTVERFKRGLAGETVPLYELEFIHKDGRHIPVELNVTSLLDADGKPIGRIGVARNISDRKHAEEEKKKLELQLQQAQRMEAIGTLAGGIAHDFNNLLMGIQGNASLALLNTDSNHQHYEKLKNIERYVQAGSELTIQLLGLARGGKYEVKPADINALVKKSSEMFGRTKKEIRIYWKYQKDAWTVEVDQTQIEQVLLNLYVNAWQAMAGGGDLYLETENIFLDENYVKPFGVEPGKYVKISVTDSGAGMDEATKQRIFDPFFTTKEMGRGTGLGLASAYGIIRNHNGIINVYSEKDEGTTFNIYLPASEKEATIEDVSDSEVLSGTGTVLLIDDEDMIIDVGTEMLEVLGYEVLTARSGREGIELYKQNQDRLDIVILDMIMPEMDGGEIFDRLKEINPNIKTLLSSGYSINGKAAQIMERGCNGFIQKPFNMSELSGKIQEILNKEKP